MEQASNSKSEETKNESVSDSDEDTSSDEAEVQQTVLNSRRSDFYTFCLKVFNKPSYEDITAMINSTVPTLIDGDALVMYAVLQESHVVTFGNQFLHIVYVCERFLDLLTQKGANCILVFFDCWELAWKNNSPLKTLRKVVHHHFKYNTTIRTKVFTWYYSPHFQEFKHLERPRAILSNLNVDQSVNKFNTMWGNESSSLNDNCAYKLFVSNLVYCVGADLPIIDINHITIGVTLIHSFNISAKPVDKKLKIMCSRMLMEDLPLQDDIPNVKAPKCALKTTRDLILQTAAYFLKSYNNDNELRFLLLYYAAQITLSPENRAPSKLEIEGDELKALQDIIDRWHYCLNIMLSYPNYKKNDFDYQHIADVWQGTLFACILNVTKEVIVQNAQLGSLHVEYESLISHLNSILQSNEYGLNVSPYPITPFLSLNGKSLEHKSNTTEMVKLSNIDNPLIDKFCKNIFDQTVWENPTKFLNTKQFTENRHWHCKRSLEIDFQSKFRTAAMTHSSRKDDRQYQKEFRYTNIYGQNLEGKLTQYDAIIYQDPKKNKTATKKQSQSTKLMLKKICEEKAKTCLENEKKELKIFNEEMMHSADALRQITNIISRMSFPETVVKGNLLKLKILRRIISGKIDENKIDYIKDAFLTIRTILTKNDDSDKVFELDDKDKKYISKLLHLYGFGEVAQKNNLPTNDTYKEMYKYNWVRFQLEHLGADLLQESGSTFDPDINFAPDKWQVDFIEAIRHNESALVVAPTSSGKTFACYYCMKRVLQYSLDGIVIYVAPTKALVNQVAATVTHRFKNVNLPEEGSSLVGIFTRDHRRSPVTSRILITVPQCLDILLMSPRLYNWNKKVKYVIFDEVHRLGGNEEGLVWERLLLMIRCPFLALSATISDVDLFYQWLQNMEHFKKEQDRLNKCSRQSYKIRCVIHEERHADLTKYVYSPGCLQHYHPYAALHRGVLLHRGKIPESVTLSPKETMQLYDVLSNYAEKYIPRELEYITFFNGQTNSGFITRKLVRKYEKELGKIFYGVYEEDKEIYNEILKSLTPPDYEGTVGMSISDGVSLLNHMADNKMLPAIVFTYNRILVEHFCWALVPKIESVQNEKSRKEHRAEKKMLKLKLKKKRNQKPGKDQLEDDYDCSIPVEQDMQKNPINILAPTKSKFKGIGVVDRNDLEFIETRLYYSYLKHSDYKNYIIAQLQSGLGYHHAGVPKTLRDTVEMLFRMGILKVVCATGTLALGVHMPCKSVVIYGDSPFLNSLEYHQMAGRAGRRGFDKEGNVIFLSLTKKRHDMLMTDKLPKLLGNYPINVSLVARLLLLISDCEDNKVPSDEYVKISVSRALTLLENSLIFEVKPHLKQQVKLFVGFALQFLLIQEIINTKGIPTPWCCFVIHLHYHEPANLALTYLIRCGAFTQLEKSTTNDVDLQWKLVVVLSYLFTKIPLNERHLKIKPKNSVLLLDPLPDCIQSALSLYNREVNFVFNQYFLSATRQLRSSLGQDNTLPLSKVEFNGKNDSVLEDEKETLMNKIREVCYKREVTSAFAALSGNTDHSLHTRSLINNIRHEICPDINIVPEVDMLCNLNGYALDFYRHGSKTAIDKDNGLKQGQDYQLLNDFRLVIATTVLALEDLEEEGLQNERLLSNFKTLNKNYQSLFANAYHR